MTNGNGDTYGFVFNDAPHFYLKNVQGDIVGITDAFGNIEAKYTYDAWGRLISITDSEGNDVTENSEHIGYINPFRYRGYYYDQETGLYYLNARYYDPVTHRFINADSTLSGGLNLFAYCYNNPERFIDLYGDSPGDLFDTPDEAVADFGRCFNGRSIDLNREFASLIYVLPTGKYSYTDPEMGEDDTSGLDWRTNINTGEPYAEVGGRFYPLVAAVHSHGAYARISLDNYFSITDMFVSWARLKRPLYVTTPKGYLKKFDNSRLRTKLLSEDMPKDRRYQRI